VTVVTYPLDAPPSADQRGGDCRARDLNQGRNVHGPHRFAATTHCRISNGIIRATVLASGAAPALTIEAYRGLVITGDTFTITYHPTYGGIVSDEGWEALGAVTIDSPSVSALLTAVRLDRIDAERLTLRLVAPLMGDAYVTLRRGERMLRITHGNRRADVDIDRRVRLTDSPSPTGAAAAPSRIEETGGGVGSWVRLVASLDAATANAGAFSLTASSVVSARFGAGAGTGNTRDTAADMHKQLRDASRAHITWSED
jgi:hypothetical protein